MSNKIKLKVKKKIKKKTKDSRIETTVYCGPSLRNLQQFSVFKGDLPGHVQTYIKKFPMIKELIVPIRKFALTKLKINKKGTRENRLFVRVLDFMKGGN